MRKFNEQIDIIDTILNDDKALDFYIKDIENSNIRTPSSLESNILKYINNSKFDINDNNKKTKHIKPLDILKIAACTILSLLLWQAVPLSVESMTQKTNIEEEKPTYLMLNTNEFYKKINQFMFKPINIERREK